MRNDASEPRLSAGIAGAVAALAAISCVVFCGVAIQELNYAGDHPFRYGPAKVIATGAAAGALLSVSVVVLAVALGRRS